MLEYSRASGLPVISGAALGTPTSGNLVNCTGYTAANVSGLGTIATLASTQAMKAYVTFNEVGTVTITNSFNVTSITDSAVGKFVVNFTNAFADANYSFGCGGKASGVSTPIGIGQDFVTQTTTTFPGIAFNSSTGFTDSANISLVFIE